MVVNQKEDYTLVTSDENTFQAFYSAFLAALASLKTQHLIIQVSENLNTSEEDIFLFLDMAQEQKNSGMSFAVICSEVNNDVFPEHFNIVPTLIEAEDVLQMEAIERDLGF